MATISGDIALYRDDTLAMSNTALRKLENRKMFRFAFEAMPEAQSA
ncbi:MULTISPECIES: hypothetical protein [unclassified Salinisphaera]